MGHGGRMPLLPLPLSGATHFKTGCSDSAGAISIPSSFCVLLCGAYPVQRRPYKSHCIACPALRFSLSLSP
jgi:hypothetical protein